MAINIRNLLCILVGLAIMGLTLTGCNDQSSDNQGFNLENKNVLLVKNGFNEYYPDKTYGEAFENFFVQPTWRYFVSTKNEEIVEFTGYCTYQGVEVKVLIQFTLYKTNFEISYLSLNGVPQSGASLRDLIYTIFNY